MLEKHNASFIRETQKQCKRVFFIFCWFWCRFGYDYREERFVILETQRGNFFTDQIQGKNFPLAKSWGKIFPHLGEKNHCFTDTAVQVIQKCCCKYARLSPGVLLNDFDCFWKKYWREKIWDKQKSNFVEISDFRWFWGKILQKWRKSVQTFFRQPLKHFLLVKSCSKHSPLEKRKSKNEKRKNYHKNYRFTNNSWSAKSKNEKSFGDNRPTGFFC